MSPQPSVAAIPIFIVEPAYLARPIGNLLGELANTNLQQQNQFAYILARYSQLENHHYEKERMQSVYLLDLTLEWVIANASYEAPLLLENCKFDGALVHSL